MTGLSVAESKRGILAVSRAFGVLSVLSLLSGPIALLSSSSCCNPIVESAAGARAGPCAGRWQPSGNPRQAARPRPAGSASRVVGRTSRHRAGQHAASRVRNRRLLHTLSMVRPSQSGLRSNTLSDGAPAVTNHNPDHPTWVTEVRLVTTLLPFVAERTRLSRQSTRPGFGFEPVIPSGFLVNTDVSGSPRFPGKPSRDSAIFLRPPAGPWHLVMTALPVLSPPFGE